MYIFSHPSKAAGGVQSLIINLTSELVARGFEVIVVDRTNGFIRENLELKGIPFNFCSIDSVKDLHTIVKPSDIYVSFGNFETDFHIIKDLLVKIYYWQVHPDFLSLVFRIRKSTIPTRFQIKNPLTQFLRNRLYKQLISHNAMCIMSESHLKFARSSERDSLINNILQIPVDNIPTHLTQARKPDGNLNIVYIGRPQDWKILPFLVVLRDLNSLNKSLKTKIKLFVVTTEKEMFQQFIEKHKIDNCLDIEYVLGLSVDSLELFLTGNADLVFSMGTSLLESSKFGIPSVFADAIFMNDLPKTYKYRWLFETNGFNLGNPIYNEHDILNGNSIHALIISILESEYLDSIRSSCYNYVRDNHSIASITNEFINKSNNSSLRSRHIRWLTHFFRLKKLLRKS